ncbi:hypothetical protein GCM10020001_115380 [Nonomuraea salmonea]
MQRLTVKVLGPLEVTVGGRPVRLTRSRLRTLLVALALSAGKTVSMDRLAEMVWSDEFPANSRRTLQNYAGGLRGALGGRWIETRPNGLLLRAAADDVDALRFVRLAEQAAHARDTETERGLLDEAMALSRGEPFEDVPSRWLHETEAPHLAERWLAALERRADLDVAGGPAGDVLAELSKWAPRYPLRESLWLRLLKALDRHGRRAEALQRYEELRSRLAHELGIDPGPELRHLHASLLADHPAPPPPRRPPAQHRSLTGSIGRSFEAVPPRDRLADTSARPPAGGTAAPPMNRPHLRLRDLPAGPRTDAIEPGGPAAILARAGVTHPGDAGRVHGTERADDQPPGDRARRETQPHDTADAGRGAGPERRRAGRALRGTVRRARPYAGRPPARPRARPRHRAPAVAQERRGLHRQGPRGRHHGAARRGGQRDHHHR